MCGTLSVVPEGTLDICTDDEEQNEEDLDDIEYLERSILEHYANNNDVVEISDNIDDSDDENDNLLLIFVDFSFLINIGSFEIVLLVFVGFVPFSFKISKSFCVHRSEFSEYTIILTKKPEERWVESSRSMQRTM